nr:tape measure protein [uncultured Celeribacter sp.]
MEKLIVQLSADIKGYEREMRKVVGVTQKQARAVEQRYVKMNKNLDRIGRSSARALIAPLAGVGAALTTREVMAYADAWTVAQNKLNAASQISGKQARSLESLNEIANETRSGISETVDLYAKLLRSTADVAESEEDVARATEIVNKAFKAGGAAASEQAAGILQLSQGLGSGLLQGDELRSVRENAPILAQAIADYYSVSIAGLKDLGSQGQITSEGVFKAILSAGEDINAAFATTSSTIEEGVTKVRNAFTQYIGQTDDGLDATSRLVAGLNAVADNMDTVADTTLQLAAVIAGALVGRSLAGMIAKLGLGTAGLVKFVAALRAAKSMAGVATAIGGVSAAAGPIGAVVGVAAVGAFMAYSAAARDSSAASSDFQDYLDAVSDSAEAAAESVGDAAEELNNVKLNRLIATVRDADSQLEDALGSVERAFNDVIYSLGTDVAERYGLQGLQDDVADLWEEVREGEKTADEAKDAIAALANSNPNFQRLAERLFPLLDALSRVSQAARNAKADLATVSSGVEAGENGILLQQIKELGDQAQATREWVVEQKRLNDLTSEQVEYNKELARVRKEAAAAGVVLSPEDERAITQGRIDAQARRREASRSSRRGGSGTKTVDAIGAVQIDIANFEEQARVMQAAVASGKDWEDALAALEIRQRILNQAQKEGITLSPEQISQVDQLSDAYVEAAGDLEKMQAAARAGEDTLRSLFGEVLDGADSASDAVANLLKEIAKVQFAKGALGLLGQTSWGGAVIKTIGGLTSFDVGGYTGPGGKFDAAGVVHKGEYVMDADTVRRAGGPEAFDAIRAGLRGYANGGYVGTPKIAALSARAAVPASPQVIYVPQPYVASLEASDGGQMMAQFRSVADQSSQSAVSAYDKVVLPGRIEGYSKNPRRNW